MFQLHSGHIFSSRNWSNPDLSSDLRSRFLDPSLEHCKLQNDDLSPLNEAPIDHLDASYKLNQIIHPWLNFQFDRISQVLISFATY
jgi:hypothetical protein